MSCKSAIYTANTNTNSVTIGDSIPLGSVIRRFGSNLELSGNDITLRGSGYYDVDASITLTGTTAGIVVISLYKDGVPVTGATVSETVAAGTTYNMDITALVREICGCNNASSLSFVVTGVGADINNIGVVVEKI